MMICRKIKRLEKMRNTFIYLWFLTALPLIILSCNSGNQGSVKNSSSTVSGSDTAVIFFTEYEHDFGKITEGEKVACIFRFENKGTAPLIINSAITSCGCTVPKYDTKPISPGGKGSLEVVFDSSGRDGMQTKTVTVQSNATKPVVLLKIKGEVIRRN